MMRALQGWVIIGFTAALTAASTSTADACSCGGAQAVVFSQDGAVPTDFGGITIWEGRAGDDDRPGGDLGLERLVDGGWIAEDVDAETLRDPAGFGGSQELLFLKPDPFEPGDVFRIQPSYGAAVEVEVGSAAGTIAGTPILQVGQLEHQSLRVATAGGSCDQPVWSATRSIAVNLPPDLEPFRDVLLYQTTVNGEPYRPTPSLCSPGTVGRSWVDEPGTDLLAAACECADEDRCDRLLPAGTFEVQIHAFLPGTDYPVWSTPEVLTELSCEAECVELVGFDEGYERCATTDDETGCATTSTGAGDALVIFTLAYGCARRRQRGAASDF